MMGQSPFSASGEEKQSSWSCYTDIYNVSSTLNLAVIGQAVLETRMFESNGYIHVYSHGTGTNILLGSKYLYNLILQALWSFLLL